MRKYLRVYRTLLSMNFSSLIMYRGNFYNSLLASLAWGFFSLFSIVLLTSKTASVFGWRREEILLLNGMYGIIIGIFHMVFSRNFERLSTIIHFGQLDGVLTKPIDSQFLLTFWLFGYATISRVLIATIYTLYIAHQLSLTITLKEIGLMTVLSGISLLLLYAIWFIILTITIWYTRLSNLTELMFSVTGMARYPQEVLRQLTNYIFLFLLPLTLIITVPAKVYLGRLHIMDIVSLVILSMLIFAASRKFWKFALRYYTSASS